MGIHHFTDFMCNRCNEYANDDLTTCCKCDNNVCDKCVADHVTNLIETQVEEACETLYAQRYKEFSEKSNTKKEVKSIDCRVRAEFKNLLNLVTDGLDLEQGPICLDCHDGVIDKITQILYKFQPQSLSEHLLDFTDFKTMEDAKKEFGTFEKFLALKAGFESLKDARKDHDLRTEKNIKKGCKKRIQQSMKKQNMRFTELMSMLLKNESSQLCQPCQPCRPCQPCQPTNEADFWFLENEKIKEFVKARKSPPEQKDDKVTQEKITSDYVSSLVYEWEFELYLDQIKGQVYWKKQFKNRNDNL